ncbi:TerB N-terminal domain-containing protein [Bifidobacterium boum]|uniref:TerB N-terminal domain-containing protein n=1 Tax=Bifidobacterium boum TaxID=78343 RepID=UPI00242BB326|nr:TerB N-terminal domain-containing protein [Bifidobacterium boum]MCI5861709.1 TerB N-terminal domain-containing protein [Bifidobacterium boum]
MDTTGGFNSMADAVTRYAVQNLSAVLEPGRRGRNGLTFRHRATGRIIAILIDGRDLLVRCTPQQAAHPSFPLGVAASMHTDHDSWVSIKLDGSVDFAAIAGYMNVSSERAGMPAHDPAADTEDARGTAAAPGGTQSAAESRVYTDVAIPARADVSHRPPAAGGVYGHVEDDTIHHAARRGFRPDRDAQPAADPVMLPDALPGILPDAQRYQASASAQSFADTRHGDDDMSPLIDMPVDAAGQPIARALPGTRPRAARPQLPTRLRHMRSIRAHYTFRNVAFGRALDFYLQGASVADYRDTSTWHGIFRWQHPTYRDMDNAQLRGYFAWRTRFLERADGQDHAPAVQSATASETPDDAWYDTCVAFAKVRVYEIICGITPDPEQGYQELTRIAKDYAWQDTRFAASLAQWIRGYIIDRNLTAHITADTFSETIRDRMIATLTNPAETTDEEYLDAAIHVSAYHVDTSAFTRRHRDIVQYSLRRICQAVDRYLREQRHTSLADVCFGQPTTIDAVRLFPDAVYLDTQRYRPQADYGMMKRVVNEPQTVVIDPIRSYRWTTDGHWHLTAYTTDLAGRVFGEIMRVCDRQLRRHHHFGHDMKAPPSGGLTHALIPVIDQAIDEIERARLIASRPHITIDMHELARIRHDADITRDALIVDDHDAQAESTTESTIEPPAEQPAIPRQTEQAGAPPNEAETTSAPQSTPILAHAATPASISASTSVPTPTEEAPTPSPTPPHDSTATDPEHFLVRSLLNHEPYEDELRRRHESVSMLVDRINERMMDDIGDTVIEFDGDRPVIIEDYEDDLRQWLTR